jgi:hypothetical protein
VVAMNTQNDIMFKLNTYKKIIRTIWYLTFVIGVLIIICVFTFSCFNLLGTRPLGHLVLGFTAPGLKMNVESNLIEQALTPALISIGINVITIWFLLLYSLHQFFKIFESFVEKNTPFIIDNVYRIKRISYSFFIYSIIVFATGMVLKLLFVQSFLTSGLNGIKMNINVSIPFWPIVCGIFVLGIAEIFSYGLKLQQDNNSIV